MVVIIDVLKKHWTTQGIAFGPPVFMDDIEAFERKYSVLLPEDVREYLLKINGMNCNCCDENLIRFWSLSEVTPLSELGDYRRHPESPYYFVFADWSLSAREYAIRLSSDPSAKNTVVVTDSPAVEVAKSFQEFIQHYLAGNAAVLFPAPGT